MPFAAWLMMFLGPSAILASEGTQSLRYFTVLSNLFEGLVSIIWLATRIPKKGTHLFEVLKLIACQSVFLTFVTVMAFLGPLLGYGVMFEGGNLWLHLVIPAVAAAEMIFFVREDFSIREVLLGLIPVILYGTVYSVNPAWDDFYGFFQWGIPAALLIYAGMCLIVFISGCVLRKIIARKDENDGYSEV